MKRLYRRLMHRLGLRGHFYPWSEVKASKHGGPAPRCRLCGRAAR